MFTTSCPTCLGQRFIDVGVPCPDCDGEGGPTGEQQLFRCPNQLLDTTTAMLSREFHLAFDKGIYPHGTSPLDQPDLWDALFRIYTGERQRILKEIAEERRQRRQANS